MAGVMRVDHNFSAHDKHPRDKSVWDIAGDEIVSVIGLVAAANIGVGAVILFEESDLTFLSVAFTGLIVYCLCGAARRFVYLRDKLRNILSETRIRLS